MIKPRRTPWPYPGDDALDRARRCAHTYRAALAKLDPAAAAQIDTKLSELGEPWVAPQAGPLDLNLMLTAQALADYLGGEYDAARIRKWASRGHLPRHTSPRGNTVYRVGDALDYIATIRRARAARRTG